MSNTRDASEKALREIRSHIAHGTGCFLLIVIVASLLRADFRSLIATDPVTAAALLIGAMIYFAPVIIFISIGALLREP